MSSSTNRPNSSRSTVVRTAVQAVKADNVATLLGRKLTTAYQGKVGNDFSTRIQGTRIPAPDGADQYQTLR